MNPFLCFAHEERAKAKNGHLLSDWKAAHKGLGGKWKALDRNGKAKYVETSKKMRGAYENQMKGYRIKKQELLREIKAAKKTKRSAKRPTKIRVASKNKSDK